MEAEAPDGASAARARLALPGVDGQLVLVLPFLTEEIPPVGYGRTAAVNSPGENGAGCLGDGPPFMNR